MPLLDPEVVRDYTERGWWGTDTVSALVRGRARETPDGAAYLTPTTTTTWAEYDVAADRVAAALWSAGVRPGDRVGVLLPDDAGVHEGLLGCERAGAVAVGLGWRAGPSESAHLLHRTGARVLLTASDRAGVPAAALVDELRTAGAPVEQLLLLDDLQEGGTVDPDVAVGPNDLWLLNSTSGTTGLPKVVTQFQNRWMRFLAHAVDAGGLGDDEVLMSVIPAPFGFGLWTSHVAPAVLGAPTAVLPRFSVTDMIELIDRVGVTVLCCVSTQFRMLLNAPAQQEADLSSMRVMFTGGEMIPPERAAEFEDRTGAVVLSFFGSNETGALTVTRHDDPRDKRLTTVGRALPEMQLRLYDDSGTEVTAPGTAGVPGGRGPLTCAGYLDDEAANAELVRPDGWMLMGDLVTVDDEGYVQVVGRVSDIIIRGGKNISAVHVETEVDSHPAVDQVAVVPVPDELFGERVCAVVTLHPGATLDLAALQAHLTARGLGGEQHPEHLLVVPELPRSSGGKLAKGEVRALAARALAPAIS